MADTFATLEFTRDWRVNGTKDEGGFPTHESNEEQVRADMQALHEETREYINGTLRKAIQEVSDRQTVSFSHVPTIGANGNWQLWSEDQQKYVDSGISAWQGDMDEALATVAKEAAEAVTLETLGAYSKEETLSDATKELYGLDKEAKPDDVLRVAGSLSENGALFVEFITESCEWKAPDNLRGNKIKAYVFGGGGGGGGSCSAQAGTYHYGSAGGGGGGGHFTVGEVSVARGETVEVCVGFGGSGGAHAYLTDESSAASDGGAGGESFFGSLRAAGGAGGKAGVGYTGGDGGDGGSGGGGGAPIVYSSVSGPYNGGRGGNASYGGGGGGAVNAIGGNGGIYGGGGGGGYSYSLGATVSGGSGGTYGGSGGGGGNAPEPGKAGVNGYPALAELLAVLGDIGVPLSSGGGVQRPSPVNQRSGGGGGGGLGSSGGFAGAVNQSSSCGGSGGGGGGLLADGGSIPNGVLTYVYTTSGCGGGGFGSLGAGESPDNVSGGGGGGGCMGYAKGGAGGWTAAGRDGAPGVVILVYRHKMEV